MKSQVQSLTEAQIENLIFGADLLSGLPVCFASEAARHAAFLAHANELVKLFAQRRPGMRPSLWWELCAPEERRTIGQAGSILPNRSLKPYDLKESEAQFLNRLNLGMPFEKKIIKEKIEEDAAQQAVLISSWKDTVEKFGERGKASVLRVEKPSDGLSLNSIQ